jgi:hypothetical protein
MLIRNLIREEKNSIVSGSTTSITSVSDPDSLNPDLDPGILLNPDPYPGCC